jgi:hypothetical protein
MLIKALNGKINPDDIEVKVLDIEIPAKLDVEVGFAVNKTPIQMSTSKIAKILN